MADISKINPDGGPGAYDLKDAVARQKLTVIDPTEGEGLITFGVDANGNYGYKKVGADTVTPFKTGGGDLNYLYFECQASVKGYNTNNKIEMQNNLKNKQLRLIFDTNTNLITFTLWANNQVVASMPNQTPSSAVIDTIQGYIDTYFTDDFTIEDLVYTNNSRPFQFKLKFTSDIDCYYSASFYSGYIVRQGSTTHISNGQYLDRLSASRLTISDTPVNYYNDSTNTTIMALCFLS